MGLGPGTPIEEIALDRVFIGSCTNSRIGDLRAAAEVVKGRKVALGVNAMVVPGSEQVKRAGRGGGPRRGLPRRRLRLARRGLLDVPGHEPRHPRAGERCASTSNRNFEGRQGRGGRTHLVSPQMAAAAAIEGHFVDIRELELARRHRAMDPVTVIAGPVSVLDRDDVDTDQIIPKQFLKRIERTGFGEFLFYDWAKEPGWDLPRQPDPRRRAQLRLRLLARARAVGARGLRLQGDHRADVRRHLRLEQHQDRPAAGRARPRTTCRAIAAAGSAEIDLAAQEVRFGDGQRRDFEIDPEIKHRLLDGLDDIALTLQQARRDRRVRGRARAAGPVTTAL